jgi:inner membrane protein
MASAITHFVVGAALAMPGSGARALRLVSRRGGILVSCGILAAAPDADTFAMRAFHIPYGSFFGHRGFFHSPFFLILLSALLAACAARWREWSTMRQLTLLLAASAISHPLLDMLTDGGSGVMLLFPLSEARLFFPWRPIHVSPLEISKFFSEADYILRSELPFCAAAIAVGLAGCAITAKFFPLDRTSR